MITITITTINATDATEHINQLIVRSSVSKDVGHLNHDCKFGIWVRGTGKNCDFESRLTFCIFNKEAPTATPAATAIINTYLRPCYDVTKRRKIRRTGNWRLMRIHHCETI